MDLITYHSKQRLLWRRHFICLLLMLAVCALPEKARAQVVQNQHVTSNGAGLVSGGSYTGYVSAGQIATYMYANSSTVATQGIILNEMGSDVEFTFELTGSLTQNEDTSAVQGQLVLKSSKAELAGEVLAGTKIYLVLVSDSTAYDSTETNQTGDFIFSNVPYLDFFFMVGSPVITPQTQPVVLAFEENPVFVKEVELFGEVSADGDITGTNVVVTPQLTSVTEDEQDLVFWYRDADGDGYGDPDNAVKLNANAQQAGYVDNAQDCNDADSGFNPAVVDVAGSGIDANCDGIFVWFLDADFDGYGSGLLDSSLVDTAATGQSANNLDCDDNNPFINPDAIDPPGGEIDANCDGIFGCDPIENVVITAPVDPVELGAVLGIEASYTGSIPMEAVWDWGDSTSTPGTIVGGTITGSHSYDTAGVYIVTLSLTDSCNQESLHQYAYIVIYNTLGGFVTGSGSIFSPPGALVAYPDSIGIATFGFVSRYDKKKGIPKGVTEFEFEAGEFQFVSTKYEWLVVSGSKAKFKGEGSVNGEPGYKFLISAVDGDLKRKGDPDLFRIKIWSEENEAFVVYDNERGTRIDNDPSTSIAEGSIIVHVPKTKSAVSVEQSTLTTEDINVRAFPNPTTGKVRLEIVNAALPEIKVRVMNITGQRIMERSYKNTKQIELNLGGNPAGLYLIAVNAGEKQHISKIVLENP